MDRRPDHQPEVLSLLNMGQAAIIAISVTAMMGAPRAWPTGG